MSVPLELRSDRLARRDPAVESVYVVAHQARIAFAIRTEDVVGRVLELHQECRREHSAVTPPVGIGDNGTAPGPYHQ